jgi:hypothetical protein
MVRSAREGEEIGRVTSHHGYNERIEKLWPILRRWTGASGAWWIVDGKQLPIGWTDVQFVEVAFPGAACPIVSLRCRLALPHLDGAWTVASIDLDKLTLTALELTSMGRVKGKPDGRLTELYQEYQKRMVDPYSTPEDRRLIQDLALKEMEK